jgi:hypothetical protein
MFFASLTLAFTGTYLTLDKTRSFPTLGDPDDSVVLDLPGTFMERDESRLSESNFSWEKSIIESRIPGANPRFKEMVRSSKRGRSLLRLEGGVGGLLSGYLFGGWYFTLPCICGD